jgi:diguanylate cyclase (GGDEF)-like protein
LAVDLAAVALSVLALVRSTIIASDLLRFGLLAVTSVVYVELARQVETRRRLLVAVDTHESHIDVTSVWTFASVLILPPSLAALTAAMVCVYAAVRSTRDLDGWRRYRFLYSVACVVIASVVMSTLVGVASWERGGGPELARAAVVVPLLMVMYRLINRTLILAAIMAAIGSLPARQWPGSLANNVLEFSTLILGAATAVLVVQVPPLAVLVLPAVFLLQHRALLKQLVEAATIDTKTELLNAAAWRQLAQRELERAERQHTATAVLVIDMDHFKRLNDTYGHLAGDVALRAVGEALADELRGYDAVGRFGGEEFVALLPGVNGPAAVGVAERVRARIEAVPVRVERRTGGTGTGDIAVTASIGVAATRGAGVALDDLLRAADGALYAAKAAGRNAVCRAPSQITAAA